MTLDDFTDLELQALLDGELDEAHERRLLKALENNQDLRRRYTTYARQRDLLKNWWKDN